jgi:hypothetical protein
MFALNSKCCHGQLLQFELHIASEIWTNPVFTFSFAIFERYGETFPVSPQVLDPSFTLPIGKAKVSH